MAAHARDELGIDHEALANPVQAMVGSAVSFAFGAAFPIVAALGFSGTREGAWAITIVSLLALAVSGAIGAHIGGGGKKFAAFRVLIGGGLAMLATTLIGGLIGHAL